MQLGSMKAATPLTTSLEDSAAKLLLNLESLGTGMISAPCPDAPQQAEHGKPSLRHTFGSKAFLSRP